MYEIPQQLEYKEKIVFGLTFRQLAYALVFSVFILLIFRTGINFYAKFVISMPFVCLAVGFMFFNLESRIRDWIIWYKFGELKSDTLKKEELKAKKKGIRKFLYKAIKKPARDDIKHFFGIKKIEDNLIFTKNKKLAVLKVEPINFPIKPKGEQEAIVLSFQKFLNSLDFSVQILMTTDTLNLNKYFNSLKNRVNSNSKYERNFVSYKEYTKSIVKEHSVMNRNFYLIIPETTDINIQIKICEDSLNNLNLKTKMLENKELEELLSKLFNSPKQGYPEKIKNSIDFMKINKHSFYRVIYAHGYPRMVESGFLDKLVSCSGNFNLSLHIEPCPVETTLIIVNKELQKQRADLYAAKAKNQLNPSLEIKYADTQKILEELQKGTEKLFNISLYITCKAESKEELDLLTRKIESQLNSLMVLPKQSLFRMIQGFKSCLPIAENALNIKRNVTTSALSAFFPFTSSFFKFDETGVWFGLNKNKIPIIRDVFKLSNANGICLATSGSGKSYLSKLLISRHLLNGTKVIIIDPQGEYAGLVKKFKGQRIDLSRVSKTIINPLDLMGHDYPEKRLALMDLMPVMLGELTEPQKSFLDNALTEAYGYKGISDVEDTWGREPPVLEDVLNKLQGLERGAMSFEKTTIRSIINRLNIYVDGVFSFLNRHTNIDFDNNLVCFDIGNMPKQVKPVMMFLVLDYVYMKMKKDLNRKLLVLDEAWSLLGRTEDASYVFEIVKTCRKFNLSLFLINQEVENMLQSEAGRSVLANTSYTLLLRQKPAVIDDVQKTFHLSAAERVLLLTAKPGEGLLIMEDDHSELKVLASEEEHKIITTNPDELLKDSDKKQSPNNAEQVKSENKVSKTSGKKPCYALNTFNKNQRVYVHKDLDLSGVKYLVSKGFNEYRQRDISGRKQTYLVKPYKNESPHHMVLVFEVEKYLKKFPKRVKDIRTYRTAQPDILFRIGSKHYAVEIETGTFYEKKRKEFLEKVNRLNRQFRNNWFFVLTDKNISKNYRKFGKTFYRENILINLKKIIDDA